jgi:hypothetical protein
VRQYVATLRPVRAPDPLVRFETAAGDQMQHPALVKASVPASGQELRERFHD